MKWGNGQLVDVPLDGVLRMPRKNEFGVISHHQQGGGLRQTMPIPRDPQCPLCNHPQRARLKDSLRAGVDLVTVAYTFQLNHWFRRTLQLDGVDILRRNLKHHPVLMKMWLYGHVLGTKTGDTQSHVKGVTQHGSDTRCNG